MRNADFCWYYSILIWLLHNVCLGFICIEGRDKELGRGHTNYDIQFIVVILKVTTRFFSTTTLDYWKNYMIVLGSHMPNMNYEVYCGSASVELTQ